MRGPSIPRSNSIESLRTLGAIRSSTLGNVPEENSAFAIGDDEEDETVGDNTLHDQISTPTRSNAGSRAPSEVSTDDAVPFQLRGMSEKARGKMPVGQPAFSRQNSMTSLNGMLSPTFGSGSFAPSADWVSTITS